VGGASTVEWGLALSVPLGWLAGRAPRVDEAGAEVDVALAEARALRRDVVIELRTLFWRLAGEQARVASLEAQEEETRALVRAIERRALAGEVRPVEVTRVEIELEKVAGELEAARIARSARQAELSLWLGAPESSAIVAVADLDTLPVAMDRVLALEKARATSPALQAAGAKTRALDASVVVEERARVPSFAVSGFTASELDRTALGVGVAVDLPFWNWNTGRLREAEARLAAGRRLAGVTAREVQVELIDAQAACSASVATATRLSANVVPRSEAAAATMEKAYQLGEASLLEVIDVRRTLLDARRQHVNAIAEAHIDCSRLDALVGEESE
jgi:cobalt-zinc-cadmium efflux system outer membrane protein